MVIQGAATIQYQLINELFPAEWFPINMTVIFFLGGSRVTPTDWATVIRPGIQERRFTAMFIHRGFVWGK